jgi:hypothetical protein
MELGIGITSDNPTYSDDSNKQEILDNSFLYSSRNLPNMKHYHTLLNMQIPNVFL